jgi:hypothetical protein
MAQVDYDLTTVNCVDQHLRLIKNLGRHSCDCGVCGAVRVVPWWRGGRKVWAMTCMVERPQNGIENKVLYDSHTNRQKML